MSSYAYATVAELKAYLRITSTSDDTLLADFLAEASRVLDSYVGHPLAVEAPTTRRFDAVADVDGRALTFDCGYCAGITAVVNGDGAAVPASAYVTEPRNRGPYYGITLKSGVNYTWTFADSHEGAIAVTGYWCHSENADGTPDELTRGATLQLAAWLYRSKDQVADLSRPVQTADGITILPLALPRSVMDRLASRRRLV